MSRVTHLFRSHLLSSKEPVLKYVAISRYGFLNRGFTAPKSESPIRRYRADAALNGPFIQIDARPSRDGSEHGAVRVRHASILYAAKFEPAAWSWAHMTSGSGAPKRVLSEEAITLKLQRPNCVPRSPSQQPCSKKSPFSDSNHTTTPKVLCKHNSFGFGSAHPPKAKHTPLRKPREYNLKLKRQKLGHLG